MMPIPPLAASPAPAVSINNAFPAALLDRLESMASTATENGSTGGGNTITRRNSKVLFVDYEPTLYGQVAEVAARINSVHWRFDLSHLYEQVQLARYEAEDKGEYDWHQDFGNETSCRKLSMSVQLSDPDSYEGGDLEIFKAAGASMTAPRTRGMTILFPAYQLHRVTPVTKGVRHSLVAWVSGPPFR